MPFRAQPPPQPNIYKPHSPEDLYTGGTSKGVEGKRGVGGVDGDGVVGGRCAYQCGGMSVKLGVFNLGDKIEKKAKIICL